MNTDTWRRYIFEGFAIVISILIAFSIDAWWQERQERQLAAKYVCALRTELDETVNEISRDLESLQYTRRQLENYLDNGPLKPAELEETLRASITVPNIAPPRTVQEELVGTGRIRLFEIDSLPDKLMSLRQMMKKNELNEMSQRNFVQRRFIPSLSGVLPLDGVLDSPDQSVQYDKTYINELQERQDFRNLLLERHRVLMRALPRVAVTVELVEDIQETLAPFSCE